MAWLFILLLGLGANLDNLGVGLSYGVRGVALDWQANTVISAVTLLMTATATALGHVAGAALPVRTVEHVGALLLFGVGCWVGLQTWLERAQKAGAAAEPQRLVRIRLGPPGLWLEILRDPVKADVDQTGTIDWREAITLGISLSLNNIGIGLSGGLSHYSVWVIAVVTAIGSWLTLSVGSWLGRTAGARWLGAGASYLAMALLLLLAMWEWHTA